MVSTPITLHWTTNKGAHLGRAKLDYSQWLPIVLCLGMRHQEISPSFTLSCWLTMMTNPSKEIFFISSPRAFFKYLGLWWNIVNPRSASLFSSTLQDLPPQRKQYPEWAGTSHIKHSSKMFHRLAYKSFSHLKCALPRFVCICVKLTKTSQDIFQTPYYSLREDLEKTVRHATILIMLLK